MSVTMPLMYPWRSAKSCEAREERSAGQSGATFTVFFPASRYTFMYGEREKNQGRPQKLRGAGPRAWLDVRPRFLATGLLRIVVEAHRTREHPPSRPMAPPSNSRRDHNPAAVAPKLHPRQTLLTQPGCVLFQGFTGSRCRAFNRKPVSGCASPLSLSETGRGSRGPGDV